MTTTSPAPRPVAGKIMIIRHGEKPSTKTPPPPFGIDENGSQEPDCGKNFLTVQGWTRAGGLASLFGADRGPLQSPALARPQHLFACKVETDGSHRPHDTILPLSRKLGVPIVDQFGQNDFAPMIADAMSRSGVVLICWEHKRIQLITAQMPRKDNEPPDAYHWPGKRFDMVFVFDLDGDKYTFQQVPELLLYGDKPKPIDVHKVKPEDEADDD